MYYPRSFLKFILLGFLLVSLPLVYALGELLLSLDRLATQSRAEVLQASQAARRAGRRRERRAPQRGRSRTFVSLPRLPWAIAGKGADVIRPRRQGTDG